MTLVGGLVREPEHGNWDELTSLPGPPRFLRALFSELCGVDVSDDKSDTAHNHSEEDGVAEYQFICGTDEIGYEQKETVVLESSDFPISVEIRTFGLPEIEVVWDFDLTYQGQLGHCGFRHRHLLARFDSAQAKVRFENVWTETFGNAPVFGSEEHGGGSASR